jgi:hypothetical protein
VIAPTAVPRSNPSPEAAHHPRRPGPFVPFALAALDALDGGNPQAAQALAASVLDTVVNGYFGNKRYVLTPNRSTTTTAEYENFTVREFIAFAPL